MDIMCGVNVTEHNYIDCSSFKKYVSYVNKYMEKQQDNAQSLLDACSGVSDPSF